MSSRIELICGFTIFNTNCWWKEKKRHQSGIRADDHGLKKPACEANISLQVARVEISQRLVAIEAEHVQSDGELDGLVGYII